MFGIYAALKKNRWQDQVIFTGVMVLAAGAQWKNTLLTWKNSKKKKRKGYSFLFIIGAACIVIWLVFILLYSKA